MTMSLTGAGKLTGVAALLASIDAIGWTGQYNGTPPTFTPDTSPVTVPVSRPGYDATGATTTYTDNLILTQRTRIPYNSTTPPVVNTSNGVALSDYVYSTDTIAGTTNNSTVASPQPIANWALPDRQTVGNSLTVEVIAFHRDGRNQKPVACVVFTATDGTSTVSQTVTALSVSGQSYDQGAVQVYKATLDITSLTDQHEITVNAKVYPWIGGAASVLDSSTTGAGREGFSPRYYRKDVTRAASPPLAYVTSTGVDASGVWSTTAATASASPFLTVAGAIAAITGAAATGGIADGCEIRIGTGSFVAPARTSGAVTQQSSRLTITRDPNVTAANAVLTFGAAKFEPYLGNITSAAGTQCVAVKDCTIQRTGALGMTGEGAAPSARLEVQLQQVILNPNGNTGTLLGSNCDASIDGMTETAQILGTLAPVSSGKLMRIRGLNVDVGNNTVEGFFLIGSKLTTVKSITAFSTRTDSGSIRAFNWLSCSTASTGILDIGSTTGDVTGAALVSNVIEWTGGNQYSMRFSGDGQSANLTHVIIWNNTVAGANNAGRWNMFYDETTGTLRTHKLSSVKGNIICQINHKSDWFLGVTTNPADTVNHVNAWSFNYGVGCGGNFSLYIDAGPNQPYYRQAYPGAGAKIGTSSTVMQDPGFTTYAGTTYNGSTYTNGAGGGNYHITVGGAAKGVVAASILPFDLDGTARAATNDTAGAYA